MIVAARKLKRGLSFIYRTPRKIDAWLDARERQRNCVTFEGVRLLESCKIYNNRDRGSIQVGARSVIRGELLTFGHGGEIVIGGFCYVGENSRIWSSCSVKIGDRVLISHAVNIHDNNAHSLSATHRHDHFIAITTLGHPKIAIDILEKAIVIEDDAWIGFGSAILKGVTIGKGAIVAAHSVVTKNVDAYTIVAGNPARVVGDSRE
jgi:acetyltransferase-like isoleucine patch superfamily enzyme